MRAMIWNKENGKPVDRRIEEEAGVRGFFNESDGTEGVDLFYLDLKSLCYISDKYDVDCCSTDISDRCIYLVMTDWSDNWPVPISITHTIPLNGWTFSQEFYDYLRNNRDFFRDCFKYIKAMPLAKAMKKVNGLDCSKMFIEKFKSENLLTPEQVNANEKKLEDEGAHHYIITFPDLLSV